MLKGYLMRIVEFGDVENIEVRKRLLMIKRLEMKVFDLIVVA